MRRNTSRRGPELKKPDPDTGLGKAPLWTLRHRRTRADVPGPSTLNAIVALLDRWDSARLDAMLSEMSEGQG